MDLFGFLSADLYSGLTHPLQVASQDSCCEEEEQPASPGDGAQRMLYSCHGKGFKQRQLSKETLSLTFGNSFRLAGAIPVGEQHFLSDMYSWISLHDT